MILHTGVFIIVLVLISICGMVPATTCGATSTPCEEPTNDKWDRLPDPFKCYGTKSVNPSVAPFPSKCMFLNDDYINDISCCDKEDYISFDARLDNVWEQTEAMFVDCHNEANNKYGYKTVLEDGSTPDLNIDNGTYNVLDNRQHFQTCLSHLQAIQCARCSIDHRTILSRHQFEPLAPKFFNASISPLFYIFSNYSIFNFTSMDTNGPLSPHSLVPISNSSSTPNTTSTPTNKPSFPKWNRHIGKAIVICRDYYERLSDMCRHVRIRGVPFNRMYNIRNVPFSTFAPPYKSTTDEMGSQNVNDDVYSNSNSNNNNEQSSPNKDSSKENVNILYSLDNLDILLVSDRNCFTLDLEEYTRPNCSLVITSEKKWYNPYEPYHPPDGNSADYFNKASASLVLSPVSLYIHMSLILTIVFGILSSMTTIVL